MTRAFHFNPSEQERLRFDVESAVWLALCEAPHPVTSADLLRLAREAAQNEIVRFIKERGSFQNRTDTG